MILFPDIPKIPEKGVKVFWRLLHPPKSKDAIIFDPDYYRKGTFLKRFNYAQVEELHPSLSVPPLLESMHKQKLLHYKAGLGTYLIVLGFWRPVLILEKGYLLLIRKIFRMSDLKKMDELVPILLAPSRKGVRIFLDGQLKLDEANKSSLLSPRLIQAYTLPKVLKSKPIMEATAISPNNSTPVISYLSRLSLSLPFPPPDIYYIYIRERVEKRQEKLLAGSQSFAASTLSELSSKDELSFGIEPYDFTTQKNPERGAKKPLRTKDADSNGTSLLIKCYATYFDAGDLKVAAPLRKSFMQLRIRLDKLNKNRIQVKKLYWEFFAMIDEFGMRRSFAPSLQWWFSENAWSTYISVLQSQYPSGGYF